MIDRLPSSIDHDEILTKIENENNVPPIEKKIRGSKRQRITVASVFIIGILGITFLNDADEEMTGVQESSEENIKNLEKWYEKERLKRQQMLQLDDAEFSAIEFVQDADNIFLGQISPGTLEGKNDDVTMNEAYEFAIERLKLPSELVEETSQKGKLDADQSIFFISNFIVKSEHLITYYELILRNNEQALNIAIHDGRLSEHVLIANRYNMPEEIQNMIEVLPKQGLKLAVNNEGTAFQIVPDWALFTRDLFSILDENEARYLGIYDLIPVDGIATLVEEQELSQLGYYLASIEFTLLNTVESSAMHSRFENYYFELAEMIIFPSDIGEILNDDNK
ncbi:MAG: hypothetical protein ABWX58_11200, partial [Psychrobacillus psychrotolerans]